MADVPNHLLSFSVLALLNAHHPGAAADTFINLNSQHFLLNELPGESGYYTFKEIEGDAQIRSENPTVIEIENSGAFSSIDDYSSLTFLRQSSGRLNLENDTSIEVQVDNVNSVIGLEHEDFKGFHPDVRSFNFGLKAGSEKSMDSVIAWSIYESDLKSETLPERLDIRVQSTANTEEGVVAAISSLSSTFDYKGTLRVSAAGNNSESENIFALDLSDSRFSFVSNGQSEILGDIRFDDTSRVSITLSHPDDRFVGRMVNAGSEGAQSSVALSNGAQWVAHGQNFINRFEWKKGGVLDLTHTKESVTIKTTGTITGSVEGGSGVGIESTSLIEDGAVLRVSIFDEDTESSRYKLQLGEVTPISPQGSKIYLEVLDERTDKNTELLNIGLIQVDGMDLSNKLFVESVPTYYETALGSFKTYANIGSDGKEGFVIHNMATDLLGPSTLVKNMLDFTSATIVSHEQNADRLFSFVTDRLSQSEERGLWLSTSLQETDLHLQKQSRDTTLETRSFALGYDTDMKLPILQKGSVGFWVSQNRSESDGENASGEMDETSLGFYLHGLTDRNYRLILSGHYAVGSNELDTPGSFGINHRYERTDFKYDTTSYGLGLYLGFSHPELDQSIFFEPFVSAYTYWIDYEKTNRHESVHFETEKTHQSLTKIGVTGGYRNHCDNPWSIYGQLAWVHRFAGSTKFEGFEGNNHEVFKTDDLQESYGYLKVSSHWQASDHWRFSANAAGFISEVVKSRYEVGLSAAYRF